MRNGKFLVFDVKLVFTQVTREKRQILCFLTAYITRIKSSKMIILDHTICLSRHTVLVCFSITRTISHIINIPFE